MAQAAMRMTGYRPEQTLLVGDRIYTDIACGVNAGIDTVLVLSGETDAATAAASEIHPTWIMKDVQELLQRIQ
jgi:ribonucleotide monophosphatase NagD (HAD superfamily)